MKGTLNVMIHPSLPKSKKLRHLAEELGLPRHKVLGLLIDLWCEVMVEREGGVLTGWERPDIELAATWKGPRMKFVETLLRLGWLEEDPTTGVLSIHDWEEHQGDLIGERAADAARKRRERALKKGLHGHECPADVRRTSADVQLSLPYPTTPLRTVPVPSGPPPAAEATPPPAPPPDIRFNEAIEATNQPWYAGSLLLLSEVGIQGTIGKQYAGDYGYGRVFEVVRAAKKQKSPGGYALSALKGRWEVPNSATPEELDALYKAMKETKAHGTQGTRPPERHPEQLVGGAVALHVRTG